MFAGDGINDLAALSAADIGFAISAAEANAAADIATAHPSVSGACICVPLCCASDAEHSSILYVLCLAATYCAVLAGRVLHCATWCCLVLALLLFSTLPCTVLNLHDVVPADVAGLVIFIKDAKCVHGLIVAMFKVNPLSTILLVSDRLHEASS